MVLISHPTGNENVRHAACSLQKGGLLEEFWTCLAPSATAPAMKLLPRNVKSQFLRRNVPDSLRPHVRTHPWREIGRFAASRLGVSRLTRHEVGLFSVDRVYRDLDRTVARRVRACRGRVRAVYAYEDGALETFRAAAGFGMKRIYDLPIAYWRAGRRIFLEEAEREPEWAITLDGLGDSEGKLARKDEEIRLADCVLVASSFTKATLNLAHAPAAPSVHVIPYGTPAQRPAAGILPRAGRSLRVLFVGSLGQRKGISYLLRACESLGSRVELTLIGNRFPGECPPLDAALRRHRWIPTCPHQAVLEEMRRHDVFVLPSLFEGYGLVMLEALSQGIPVITTPHTGGPDLLAEGEDGFIVPVRSASQIAERLERLLSDPALLVDMKNAALRKAGSMTWERYESRLLEVVESAMSS